MAVYNEQTYRTNSGSDVIIAKAIQIQWVDFIVIVIADICFFGLQLILDLSHNELSHLPLESEVYWSRSLQNLNLSHNNLTTIDQCICRLGMYV